LLRRVLADGPRSPARYEEWLAREPWLGDRFPDAWRGLPDLPLQSDAQSAAVVHVFYPELLGELLGHLALIPAPFDLIVTNASGVDIDIESMRVTHLQHTVVLEVENRGRDLWPLVQVVNAGLLDRYLLVVKVHTKRSDWREGHDRLGGTGGSWRGDLLSGLLGDAANVGDTLDAFKRSPALGMVTADGSVLGPEFWGRNIPVTAALLRRLDLELSPHSLNFASGSMYWARASILRRLGDLRMSSADFEDEEGQIDGTTAHALERTIGLLATEAGLHIVERSQLAARA
jgi:lipopolysaccharide biosynthesis protein